MNERIKELVEQAEQYAFDKANEFTNEGDDDDYECLFDLDFRQKFAELIVKETLQVARAGIEFGDGMEDAVYKYFEIEE